MNAPAWHRLGATPATALVAARLELHYAAQIPAALGIARATPTPDFAQHALTWNAEHGALVSAPVPGRLPHRAGLALAERALFLLDGGERRVAELALEGRTLREGLDWLAAATARLTGEKGAPLALPEHELPAHGLARGARFGSSSPAHAEIARWYANLAPALEALRAGEQASPLRVWSHHFDLDTVVSLGGERTLGLGFSPGDDGYAEPYLYVLPTPYPSERELPEPAPPFQWATDGWIGAVLRGSAVSASPAQAELVTRFYRWSSAALRRLMAA